MAFSGTSYSEIETGADIISDQLANIASRLASIRSEASNIVTSLTALGTEYNPIVNAALALQNADPGNIAKQWLNAHVSALLSDYNDLLAAAQALDAEINT